MLYLRNHIYHGLVFCCIFLLILIFSTFKVFAEEIEWLVVSKTNSELISIKSNSIKYNNKGFLSVIAKHSEIDPDDQTVINTDAFLNVATTGSPLEATYTIQDDDNPPNIQFTPK